MDYWNTLLGTALMGTDRQSPTPPKPVDKFTTVLSQLNWQQPEQAILSAAGAIALYQQVGQQPTTTDWAGVAPCHGEEHPYCSHQTARHLSTVMTENHAIMPEFLRLLAHAQQRIPPSLLPKVLNFGRQRPELRPQIAAVIGKRGQWLARQHSAWKYGAAQRMAEFEPDSVIWKEGSRSERALFLHQWREVDATGAREALEAVWSSELAKDRADLITSLACNVSIVDEPFLETARCDRAQSVRQQALKLLITLPGSRLGQRMAERIEPFVTVQSKRSTTIHVVLPNAFDPDWEKDGITPKPVAGLGEKASWLYQMLTGIALSHWQGEPTAIVQAIQAHKWQTMLLKGLGMAALRQHNIVWAKALVNQFDLQHIDQRLLSDLLALLPIKQQEVILRGKVPSKPNDIIPWLQQVAECSQTLSLEFSQLVLDQIFRLVRHCDRKDYKLQFLLKDLAIILHPDLTSHLAERINQLPDNNKFYWFKSSLDDFHERLNFRYQMHEAFKPSG